MQHGVLTRLSAKKEGQVVEETVAHNLGRPHGLALFDVMDDLAFFVQQEGGHVHRELRAGATYLTGTSIDSLLNELGAGYRW